jgi:hypothetical protein
MHQVLLRMGPMWVSDSYLAKLRLCYQNICLHRRSNCAASWLNISYRQDSSRHVSTALCACSNIGYCTGSMCGDLLHC